MAKKAKPKKKVLRVKRIKPLFPNLLPVPPEVQLYRNKFAARLKKRRLKLGMSKSDLAFRADVRVQTLARVEGARVTPEPYTEQKLLRVLDQEEKRQMSAKGKKKKK